MSVSPPGTQRPIGFFGGTFDPPHTGHFRLAIECLEGLSLAEVRMSPLNEPNHRKRPLSDPLTRLAMVDAGASGRVVADPGEIERAGVTYSVESAELLKNQRPDRAVCLLMGQDTYATLGHWHRYQDLLELVHIVVVTRHLAEPMIEAAAEFSDRYCEDRGALSDPSGGKIYFHEIPSLYISSTMIRRRLAQGLDVSHLLPPPVLEIVQAKGLYR
ncbi:MAG: nicotinate (nicotinamide) nucleotide adenylyltransferase [Pseudomonadota bacterium]